MDPLSTTTGSEAVGRPPHSAASPDASGPPPSAMAAFAAVPPLAGLAALAALADLLLQRVTLPALQPKLPHTLLIDVARWGSFATNLAAIAGVIALVSALRGIVNRVDLVHPQRRLTIIFFSLVVVTILAGAALFPVQFLSGRVVLVGVAAANILIISVMFASFRHAAGWRPKLISAALASVGVCAVATQLIELSALGHTLSGSLGQYHQLIRSVGEVAHLMVLALLASLLIPSIHEPRGKLGLLVGGAVTGVSAAILLLARAHYPADYPLVFYHAQRLVLLLEHSSWVYVLPVAIAMGAATAAVLSVAPTRNQAGIGLWLLLAAGYAPRAPGRLLMLCLAAALIARALLTLSSARLSLGQRPLGASAPSPPPADPAPPR